MSANEGSSISREAIAMAFKRARHKFPKNFGTNSKADKNVDNHASENNDQVMNYKNIQESSTNSLSYTNTIISDQLESSNQLESSLISGLELLEISNDMEFHCDQCKSDDFETTGQESFSISKAEEKFENDCDQEELFIDSTNNSKCTHDKFTSTTEDQENYGYSEIQSGYNIIWKEDFNQCNNLEDIRLERIDNEKRNDVNSDEDVVKVYKLPRRYHDRNETSRSSNKKKKQQKCKKRSRSYDRQSNQFNASSDYTCDDNKMHAPNCPFYNHCRHCRYYYHHCCCRHYCCCSRCCFNCMNSAQVQESTSYTCRSSSRRQRKREKCSACKKRSTSPQISTRRTDTCSRDSGVFTNVLYENEKYDDDDDNVSPNPLMHKDSLSILQEKYASYSRRKYNDKKHARTSDEKLLSRRYDERVDIKDYEEDNYGNLKNRKFCKRLLSRCNNSY